MLSDRVRLASVTVHRVTVPLKRPYKIAVYTYHEYEAIFVEVRNGDGSIGFGEAVIRPGYNRETPGSAWDDCRRHAGAIAGTDAATAKALVLEEFERSPQAVTATVAAIEMAEHSPRLAVTEAARVPLLLPLQSHDRAALRDEIEQKLADGYRTFKVKVGFEVDDDLAHVTTIQQLVAGRASLRLDANAAWPADAAKRFVASLDPAGIELLEQPCGKDDWDGNAAVAAGSRVPIMLDEPIWTIADVERAATLPGVQYVKSKLKRCGSLERLTKLLARARALGLGVVLGDGVATDIGNWQEACIARIMTSNAGEMNGFLKLSGSVLAEPLTAADGAIELRPGYVPRLDAAALRRFGAIAERFS